MNIIKRYWFYPVFALAIMVGIGFAHWSYVGLVEPGSPYMIVDMEVSSECCPLGYEPVELTGKNPDDGVRKMISCRVPVVYEPYIHYPEGWESNPMNPQSKQGDITKWSLYGVLAVVVGLLVWRIVVITRKNRRVTK